MKYEPAKGATIEEMRDNARKGDLWKEGDIKLVWALEADLAMSVRCDTLYRMMNGLPGGGGTGC